VRGSDVSYTWRELLVARGMLQQSGHFRAVQSHVAHWKQGAATLYDPNGISVRPVAPQLHLEHIAVVQAYGGGREHRPEER
jgi:hypothetical protein